MGRTIGDTIIIHTDAGIRPHGDIVIQSYGYVIRSPMCNTAVLGNGCGVRLRRDNIQSPFLAECEAMTATLDALVDSGINARKVFWMSDCQSLINTINNPNAKCKKINKEAIEHLFCKSLKMKIELNPYWVPRERNQIADALSTLALSLAAYQPHLAKKGGQPAGEFIQFVNSHTGFTLDGAIIPSATM